MRKKRQTVVDLRRLIPAKTILLPEPKKTQLLVNAETMTWDLSKVVVDFGKLKSGVQVLALDDVSIIPDTAIIVEPGLREGDVSIKFAGQSKAKKVPFENIVEICDTTMRSNRRRKQHCFEYNMQSIQTPNTTKTVIPPSPQANKKQRTNALGQKTTHESSKQSSTASNKSHGTKKATAKKPPTKASYKQSSAVPSASNTLDTEDDDEDNPFASMQFDAYCGPQVQTIIHENNKLLYFLKFKFGKYLKRVEGELNGDIGELPKTIKKDGKDYHLIISKQKEKSIQTALFERTSKNWYVAYYLGGKRFSGVEDVKKMLEELGNFSNIALQPGKICSRLELLVSPTCSMCPNVLTLHSNNFEVIEENQHVGCGFAPSSFFEVALDVSRCKSREKVSAVQVRIFCSCLGWFKGMLMKKENITKIQLPSSMLKVEKSKCTKDGDNGTNAYIVIKNCFPSKSSDAVGQQLRGKCASKSAISKIKNLGDQYKNLLIGNGLTQDEIEDYENYFSVKGKLIAARNDCLLVGVADPTSSGLPNDAVFISGFNTENCGKVFVTRYPCTVRNDGKVLEIITQKPSTMDLKDWQFLQSIPFGLLVFAKSSTNISLPEQIGDGDLDGDLYHILWDIELVEKIENHRNQPSDDLSSSSSHGVAANTVKTKDTGKRGVSNLPAWMTTDLNNKDFDDADDSDISNRGNDVSLNLITDTTDSDGNSNCNNDTKSDNRTEGSNNDQLQEVTEILDHKDNKVNVLWKLNDGRTVKDWRFVSDMRKEVPEVLAEYALKQNIGEQYGWRWTKQYFTVTEMKYIVTHEKTRDTNKDMLTFIVMFDNGETENKTEDEMKEEAPDILFKYATKHALLSSWRNEYNMDITSNWFENAQEYASKLKLLHHQIELKGQLYKIYNKKLLEGDANSEDVLALSKAYKQSLDFRKHAIDINLPIHLIDSLSKELRVYVLNAD